MKALTTMNSIRILMMAPVLVVVTVSSSAVHRSPSRSSGLDRSEPMLYGGSMSQLNGGGNVYLPDYSVRQLTHLQIIKVTPATHNLTG